MNKLFSISQLNNYRIARWGTKTIECKNEPVTICLFMTDRCTLSCKWCLRQSNQNFKADMRQDMKMEHVTRILSYFPKATHLSLAGFGEPLLVEDLFRIVSAVKARPMRINMITNGTLLLDRIDELKHAQLHRISISINSLNAADYISTCGGSEHTFNNILKGIQVLVAKRKSKRPCLHLSFVLTRDLFSRTREIITFAEETGVDHLDLHNLIAYGGTKDYKGMLTDDDEEVTEKLKEWQKKSFRVKVGWPRLIRKGLERPARICNPLWDWFGIDVEGNTAGCSKAMPTNEKYGNLFKEGSKVWNNEFKQRLRTNFLAKNFLHDCCKSCTVVQP